MVLNPGNDCNLTLIVRKNTPVKLFLYFFVQIETENCKLIYDLQFVQFINWGTICVKFGTVYDLL